METVTVKGRTVEHNTRTWSTRTNRHPTTTGYPWGWIEGADGNVCWSDGTAFNHPAAEEMCRLHNQWLEEQKPIMLRINEATARKESARKAYISAIAAADRAKAEYAAKLEELGELLAQDI